ncbi:MAG: VWA domain-containing protein [Thermodesulfobacteriota bacterium]|nr:VWA domain-containing protein [Thermodesulfobacteriota bacterium]
MKLAILTERFYDLVAPDIPNEWDVEEVLEPLIDESDQVCAAILGHIPVIWPVSHSLCFDFLRLLPKTLQHLSLEQIPRWIGITLDFYETSGLRAAQRFMQDDIKTYLAKLEGEGGLSLATVEKRLLPYIRGIARDELQIAAGRFCYTDTSSIFIPEELDQFENNDDNFLLYKLILTFQWGFIACGSFLNKAPADCTHISCDEDKLWLRAFFDSFEEPLLARDIYHSLESIRVRIFLSHELPGLMRAAEEQIFPGLRARQVKDRSTNALSSLQQILIADKTEIYEQLRQHLTIPESLDYDRGLASANDSVKITSRLYSTLQMHEQEYIPILTLPFQGTLRLRSVETARKLKEQKMGEQFVDLMAAYLLTLSKKELGNILKQDTNDSANAGLAESDISMIMDSEFARTADQEKEAPLLVTINNEEIELPAELEDFSKNFFDEFGHLPARFLSSAAGKAGQEMLTQDVSGKNEADLPCTEALLYDEWDYRRQGYRKKWCSLHFKQLKPIHSAFIRNTLDKYHGLTIRLRHQFEMMRSQERFVKRQREGDDIDFDALVESISDSCAGISSSDRLFIRLKRDERDIAVLFLVDMSNSTAGWVNNALKESLVLMAEAMEVLGDRYGIYGFSGMRRSRCELFHVKHLTEAYGEQVKERISSIAPSEYTRMGPPIRHATALLKDVDAKIRLIITLTDGKPEDYDDYKGQYAIEDTRHALLEAKTSDIHPFCITIDHQARDYMKHMYGPANYIFIDNVRKLPLRMPEIYRVLTS